MLEFKMSKFIGRDHELKTLASLLVKRSASLIVIKGRRRIGKSRLLEEFGRRYFKKTYTFSGLPPSKDATPQSQRKEFAKQFVRQTSSTIKLNTEDWGDLFWDLSKYSSEGKILII